MRTAATPKIVTGLVTPLAAGAAAGALATLPMTFVMRRLVHELPPAERYALPPREITAALAIKAGASTTALQRNRGAFGLLTNASHYGYGAAMGALYAVTSARAAVLPGAVRGALHGLAVWSGSYLGMLPALGILKPATEHPLRRNAIMILAHLAWGVTLSVLLEAFRGGSGEIRASGPRLAGPRFVRDDPGLRGSRARSPGRAGTRARRAPS